MASDVHPDAVAAACAGAGWAFERVYATLAPAVLGYLRAQGSTDPEAALQDVFLRAFRHIERFDGTPASLRSWIFTIAHNVLVDERRFAARRPVAVPLDTTGDVVSGDTETEALDRLGTSGVQAVLATLSPEQRDVLLLRVLTDLSLDDIARVTGRSPGAVKALQRRGLDRLRSRLTSAQGRSGPDDSSPPTRTPAGAADVH